MKKSLLALAVFGSFPLAASAQTSVTVYGLIDLSVNYTTNQDAKGHSVLSLGDSGSSAGAADGGQGAMSGSRIGFKGMEDLGGGTKALFDIESGFTANNGASDQQGQLFGRQAYVGLSDTDMGQITFGRQYGILTNVAFDFDPLGVGNYVANEWEGFLFGFRFDNTIMYHKAFGPVQLDVQYSLGGQAGTPTIGNTVGASLKYNSDGLGLAAGVQQSTDALSKKLTASNADITYTFGPATLYGNYYFVQTDGGFEKAASNSGGALANTSMLINNSANATERDDSLWVVGLAYNFTPATTLTLAYMDDQITQDVVGDGSMKSAYALLEYHLSKRTEVYLTADESKASGQARTSAISGSGTINGVGAGENNSAAFAAGLRFTF